MFRLITVSAFEIRFDAEAVSEMLNHACCRGGGLWIEGVAQEEGRVRFVCTERPEEAGTPCYCLSRVGRELETELRARYDAGFRTAAVFPLDDELWILTERCNGNAAANENRRVDERPYPAEFRTGDL